MDHDTLCGNCGLRRGGHYGSSLWCPNPNQTNCKGRRGVWKDADGSEVFYNVWNNYRGRWTNSALPFYDANGEEKKIPQIADSPFRLTLKEAEHAAKYLSDAEGETIFEVRILLPDGNSLPLSQASRIVAKMAQKKQEQEKLKELSFFQQSLSLNSCHRCGAPCPCDYHG
jgi:hypothetical protein